MEVTPIGEIAQSCWQEILQHLAYVRLDEFVIMPNHVHGIIIIDQSKYKIKDNFFRALGGGMDLIHNGILLRIKAGVLVDQHHRGVRAMELPHK